MARRVVNQVTKLLFGGTAGLCAAAYLFSDSPKDASHQVLAATPMVKNVSESTITPWDTNWDNRSNTEPKPKFTRHILLVRHGQYHYADNDVDCQLTCLGREQTNLTGQRLKQLNFPYTRLVYSTMTRAIESTEEIIKHLPNVPSEPSDLIKEGAPFPPEPKVANWPSSPTAFQEDGPRIESAFVNFIHRAPPDQTADSYEILVCHANVIRYFVCRALQLPPEAWIRISLDHGSLTWLTIRPTGFVSLRYLGNSGYMPPTKLTTQ